LETGGLDLLALSGQLFHPVIFRKDNLIFRAAEEYFDECTWAMDIQQAVLLGNEHRIEFP
jgi:hypothetical protein